MLDVAGMDGGVENGSCSWHVVGCCELMVDVWVMCAERSQVAQ